MSLEEDALKDYEEVKVVGKGSFGTATLYRRKSDNKYVVMKDIFSSSETSALDRKVALNEVQIISSLHHENIIKYIASFEKDDRLVIIMEYANGGNLAQLIRLKVEHDELISEGTVLNIFSQICNGIGYMHEHKIIHRDLKTANIFLNRDATVKIGDFGISKMLRSSQSIAHTVVGTPYYLSPEICEGKGYNEKSDVWSLGCILYELVSLKKPFSGNSLPNLVQKIIAGHYEPIPTNYTDGMFSLVQMILQKDATKRPSARYIYQTIIPAIYESLLGNEVSQMNRKFSLSSIFNRSIPKERSVLYHLTGFTSDPDLFPIKLPHKIIIDYSNSGNHYLVVTSDRKVYSWGEDAYGQLAHGRPSENKSTPVFVELLRGLNIIRCFAGEGFSMFLSETGKIYTCGLGTYGCLGHGSWENIWRPTSISSLNEVNIVQLSCGSNHVLALSSNGLIYTWGSAKQGQLGLGHSQYCCKPMPLNVSNEFNVEKVFAGHDNSILLTTQGKVLVAGSNMNNKLGLGSLGYVTMFVMLEGIEEKIKSVSLSYKHTVLLTESGCVLCMGSNQDGQCGVGEYVNGILKVQDLPKIIHITAGISYSVAAAENNVVYFWGTHYRSARRQNGNESFRSVAEFPSFREVQTRFRRLRYEVPLEETFVSILQAKPTPILALYTSPSNCKEGNMVWLEGISANDSNIMILVRTTAPPPNIITSPEEADFNENEEQFLNLNRSNKIFQASTLPNAVQ